MREDEKNENLLFLVALMDYAAYSRMKMCCNCCIYFPC